MGWISIHNRPTFGCFWEKATIWLLPRFACAPIIFLNKKFVFSDHNSWVHHTEPGVLDSKEEVNEEDNTSDDSKDTHGDASSTAFI